MTTKRADPHTKSACDLPSSIVISSVTQVDEAVSNLEMPVLYPECDTVGNCALRIPAKIGTTSVQDPQNLVLVCRPSLRFEVFANCYSHRFSSEFGRAGNRNLSGV